MTFVQFAGEGQETIKCKMHERVVQSFRSFWAAALQKLLLYAWGAVITIFGYKDHGIG